MRLSVLIPLLLCCMVSGAFADGILFAGADTEEFNNQPDRISRMTTVGATISTITILNVSYNVNGLTVVGVDDLLTGTVGAGFTTVAQGKTFNLVKFDGTLKTSTFSPDQRGDSFNEDMGFDSVNGIVWRGHFDSGGVGDMRAFDVNNLGGSALAIKNLPFGVVGVTVIGTDIWITDWTARRVGIWDPGTNVFVSKFTTPNFAGALAWDSDSSVLWVGMSGGTITPYSLGGAVLGATVQPFGSGFSATVDGLGFAIPEQIINPIPEPATLVLLGAASIGVAIRRRRRKAA
ncbi:MAG: PEP-CTERM sorting domain-containing protein [Planctomycetota bacterium]